MNQQQNLIELIVTKLVTPTESGMLDKTVKIFQDQPVNRFIVSLCPDLPKYKTLILPEHRAKVPSEIRSWVKSMLPLALKNDLTFGCWTNEGLVHFDLSTSFESLDLAEFYAETWGQLAIYDTKKNLCIQIQ